VIRVAWEIDVQRAVEDVFDFVADLHNEPQFNPDASNIVQTTPGDIGLGTTFEEDFRRIGRYVTKIDVYERPGALGFDARNAKADARVRFGFTPQGDAATTVSCVVELTMKGAMRFAEPVMAPTIRKQIETSRGPMLKAALER
jgi:Polyketide cyclase / dehydrase and lipid transport